MPVVLTSKRTAPAVQRRDRTFTQCGAVCRRVLDVLLAGAALISLLPAILLIVTAIFLEDGWPIFFAQTRLGLGGKPFQLLKFRKFKHATSSGGLPLTLSGDPRMTRVGRILERTKLDELPQLWNVIKGEMSMVGPRPESLHFADCFVGSFRELLSHKPGLFGPAQVSFRNESACYRLGEDPERIYREMLFPIKASLDLPYYANRTVLRDMTWVCRGVAAVVGLPRNCSGEVVQPIGLSRSMGVGPGGLAALDATIRMEMSTEAGENPCGL